jgi:hypothetical protein
MTQSTLTSFDSPRTVAVGPEYRLTKLAQRYNYVPARAQVLTGVWQTRGLYKPIVYLVLYRDGSWGESKWELDIARTELGFVGATVFDVVLP